MKSMTGYGRADFSLPSHAGVIELSAINKKGFEFLLNGPREWQFFEKKAQDLVRSSTERGRIRLSIQLHPQGRSDLHSNPVDSVHMLEQLDTLKKICEERNVPYSPTVDLIYRILSNSEKETVLPPLEMVEDQLTGSTLLALEQLVSMRKEEGSTLADDLKKRIGTLRHLVTKIESLTRGLAIEWRNRLLQRIRESGLEIDCENESVLREFTVFSEKSDVSEEITRIHSHLDQFEDSCSLTIPIGRKLEFIVQELGREFNTLGSKSLKAEVTNEVISAKVEIEKIREQVLNIE